MINIYDFTIGLFESIVKHGLSWSTAAAVLFLILKQRAMKRKLKRYLPFMFKDEEVNPTYVNNQKTIMENQRMMMERMGLEWSGPESPMKPIPTSSTKSYQLSWGEMKMKNYLRKLGSRKFQVLLGSLAVNGLSIYLFLTGVVDIDPEINKWMPIINLIVGSISNIVYIVVEGSADKANIRKGSNNDVDFTNDASI